MIEALHTAAYVKNKTNKNKHLMISICQLHSMQLLKKKSNDDDIEGMLLIVTELWLYIQPSCKKEECGPQKGCCDKRCEIQGSKWL